MFSSKVYYKIAPPSERNGLNFSRLSSAPESEIKIKCTKESRPSVDGFLCSFQRLIEKLSAKIRHFLFSIIKSILPPCSISWSWVQQLLWQLKKWHF